MRLVASTAALMPVPTMQLETQYVLDTDADIEVDLDINF